MNLAVHLNSSVPALQFPGTKLDFAVDGDGELYVKAEGKVVAVFARGMWSHVLLDDHAEREGSS